MESLRFNFETVKPTLLGAAANRILDAREMQDLGDEVFASSREKSGMEIIYLVPEDPSNRNYISLTYFKEINASPYTVYDPDLGNTETLFIINRRIMYNYNCDSFSESEPYDAKTVERLLVDQDGLVYSRTKKRYLNELEVDDYITRLRLYHIVNELPDWAKSPLRRD